MSAREGTVKTDDLKKFYRAVDGLENTTARGHLLLLIFTSMRRAEAASLRWDDLDWADRAIKIPIAPTKR